MAKKTTYRINIITTYYDGGAQTSSYIFATDKTKDIDTEFLAALKKALVDWADKDPKAAYEAFAYYGRAIDRSSCKSTEEYVAASMTPLVFCQIPDEVLAAAGIVEAPSPWVEFEWHEDTAFLKG